MQLALRGKEVAKLTSLLCTFACVALPAAGQDDAQGVVRFKIPMWNADERPDLEYPVFAISPDGRRVVFVASQRLHLRDMAGLTARPIRGTDGAHSPFFSPDGKWVAFFTDGALRKVSLETGVVATITEVHGGRAGTWGDDETIVFSGARPGNLWRIPAEGGEPSRLTQLSGTDFDYAWPQFLPGAKALLYTAFTDSSAWGNPQNFLLVLATGEKRNLFPKEDLRMLGGDMRGTTLVRYVGSGHLIYGKSGALNVVPFDVDALKIVGGLAAVREYEDRDVGVDGVMMPGRGTFTSGFFTKGSADVRVPQFQVSASGTLVYLPGVPIQRNLVWVDRDGNEEPVGVESRSYFAPRLSPDGGRIAVGFQQDAVVEVHVFDLGSREWTRVADGLVPLWSPDGRQLVFGVRALYRIAVGDFGRPERLSERQNVRLPGSFLPDGKQIVFEEEHLDAGGDWDVGMLDLESGDESTIVGGPGLQLRPAISPDGRWLAYDSNESGQVEVYVRPFPDIRAGKWKVSVDGGARPIWRSDGNELFYRNGEAMMAVAVETRRTFRASTPVLLFRGPQYYFRSARHYDVTPDGTRFLMIRDEADGVEDQVPRELTVVVNWFDEMAYLLRDHHVRGEGAPHQKEKD
jgi:serine/threonine-protein kinase